MPGPDIVGRGLISYVGVHMEGPGMVCNVLTLYVVF